MSKVLEIDTTKFRAKCYALLRDVQARRYDKVVITRRGKPIIELRQLRSDAPGPGSNQDGADDAGG